MYKLQITPVSSASASLNKWGLSWKKREGAAFSLKIVDLKRNRAAGAKQVQWNVGGCSVPLFQDKMCSVPPWKKFFWPGLKILGAGGLASSAGSLFQCFTSLTDKKVFLVCYWLHGWNRQPETAWEHEFSDTSWAFVQTGFEIWDIWNGWITQSKSKVNWFLLVLSLFYVPLKSTSPSWSVWQILHIKRMWERACGVRAPSSLYPLPITCSMCHMKNIWPRQVHTDMASKESFNFP